MFLQLNWQVSSKGDGRRDAGGDGSSIKLLASWFLYQLVASALSKHVCLQTDRPLLTGRWNAGGEGEEVSPSKAGRACTAAQCLFNLSCVSAAIVGVEWTRVIGRDHCCEEEGWQFGKGFQMLLKLTFRFRWLFISRILNITLGSFLFFLKKQI